MYFQSLRGVKTLNKEDIEPFLKQRPNKKTLGLPLSLYFYKFGQSRYDSTKPLQKKQLLVNQLDEWQTKAATDSTHAIKKIIKLKKKIAKQNKKIVEGNFWMRVMGSKPVIYDSLLAKTSQKQIHLYYKTKGFFDNKVKIKNDTISNSVFVNYQIIEGKRTKITNVTYKIEDAALKRIVNEYFEENLIYSGVPFDEQLITNERDRLEKLFKNYGYYDFNKKYVSFEIDTLNQKCDIQCKISNLENGNSHVVYKLDSLQFDVDQNQSVEYDTDSSKYKDLTTTQTIFYYNPKVLRRKIQFNKGNKYSFSETQLTQRALTQLEVFKFVNILYKKDTSNKILKPYISATSLSKYQLSDEIGFTVSQGIPGPFGSITFTNRNALGGCEIFDLSLRGGIEGVASAAIPGNVYRSYQLGLTASLTFPRLLSIVDLNKIFVNNNPRSRFSLGYNFISRPEYQRSSTQFTMTYHLQKGNFKSFSFSLIDVNYLRTRRIDAKFDKYLQDLSQNGNNLFRSFQSSVATNMNFTYIYNTFVLGQNKKSFFLRISAEPGGTIFNVFNYNQLKDLKSQFGLQAAYIYWRVNVDIRGYLPVSKKSMLAMRFNVGLANPYAGDNVLPYEKYFFTGGTNSNRAWFSRRLGPGSFNGNTNYQFEQPGLILLELNQEYRFKIFKYLDGAIFVDAGNVWNLNDKDESKNFKSDFIKEIGIGSGIGARLDFSFLIVRLDAGFKMYDPAQPIGQRWVAGNQLNIKNALWNIAIGYPF